MGELLNMLREDLAWFHIVDRKPVVTPKGWPRVCVRAWLNRGFRAVLLYRLAHKARRGGHRIVARLLSDWMFRSCGAVISPTARIDGGLLLPHPQGVIIGSEVQIGKMVCIGQHTTLGGNFGKTDAEGRWFPRVGDWCWICAGAVVAGPVTVGEHAIVGANSVAVRDVPPYAVVGGVPAKVIQLKGPTAVPEILEQA